MPRPAAFAVLLACLFAGAVAARPALTDPALKEVAMVLVSTAENSSTDWRAQYGYIEDIGDGRGYTAGIIGFTTGTGDALALIKGYTAAHPGNGLARFLPALRGVSGTPSHRGLQQFPAAWAAEAAQPAFRAAQNALRDRVYFIPAVSMAQADGLGPLGQFAYYDAAVVHGPDGAMEIRARALTQAKPPAKGGDEVSYLSAYLDQRNAEMRKEAAHSDLSRIEGAQRAFLRAGNLNLDRPLDWQVYGDRYHLD